MNERLKSLRSLAAKLEKRMDAILDDAGDDPLDEEQRTEYDEKDAELDGVLADIEREKKREQRDAKRKQPTTDPVAPDVSNNDDDAGGDVRVGTDREAVRGFASIGEQCRAVAAASNPGTDVDKRLLHIHDEVRAATGMGEAIPSDGGFLVQQDFVGELFKKTFSVGSILGRVRRRPLSANSNSLVLNKLKEDSRADGSRYGGVRAYWVEEGEAPTASQLEFQRMELRAHRLAALLYATDELLADAAALTAEINDVVPQEIQFTVEDAILNGAGAGRPKGILQGNALATVAKEAAQVADTVVAENVVKMWGRMWARSFANAAWLCDQSVLPQLPLMTIGDQPVWTPPGQLADAPNGTLLGRPILPVEYLPVVGDLNDIVLVDLSQYLLIDKAGIEAATSMHVRFIQSEMTFRFNYRVDGQPIWEKALTPKSGGDTLSPFVNLAARA